MKTLEICRLQKIINNDTYTFVVYEQIISGWGIRTQVGRANPKTYKILKNGECILYTAQHQVYYGMKRKIERIF